MGRLERQPSASLGLWAQRSFCSLIVGSVLHPAGTDNWAKKKKITPGNGVRLPIPTGLALIVSCTLLMGASRGCHLLCVIKNPVHRVGSPRLVMEWKERDWCFFEMLSLFGAKWRSPFISSWFLSGASVKSVNIPYQLRERHHWTWRLEQNCDGNWNTLILTSIPVLTYCENLGLSLYFVGTISFIMK